jgi:hypothetical protein
MEASDGVTEALIKSAIEETGSEHEVIAGLDIEVVSTGLFEDPPMLELVPESSELGRKSTNVLLL